MGFAVNMKNKNTARKEIISQNEMFHLPPSRVASSPPPLPVPPCPSLNPPISPLLHPTPVLADKRTLSSESQTCRGK